MTFKIRKNCVYHTNKNGLPTNISVWDVDLHTVFYRYQDDKFNMVYGQISLFKFILNYTYVHKDEGVYFTKNLPLYEKQ